jgi:hypothetical protein
MMSLTERRKSVVDSLSRFYKMTTEDAVELLNRYVSGRLMGIPENELGTELQVYARARNYSWDDIRKTALDKLLIRITSVPELKTVEQAEEELKGEAIRNSGRPYDIDDEPRFLKRVSKGDKEML